MFKEAVAKGDITWHAGPMNMQIENMNELLLGLSLNISTDLDSMFGINRKHRVLSQRDVPGNFFSKYVKCSILKWLPNSVITCHVSYPR
jgi:hypothetical protein